MASDQTVARMSEPRTMLQGRGRHWSQCFSLKLGLGSRPIFGPRGRGQGDNFTYSTLAFGRPFQITVRPMLCCLSCLSVTLMYSGQAVGWIKMPLRTEVGLDSGHIVLDEDPAPHW